jgi:chemotaxis protein MotA
LIQRLIIWVGVMFFLLLSGNVVGETSPIMNFKSGLLVLAGTLLSVLLAYPMKTIRDLAKHLRDNFQQSEIDPEVLVHQMERMARVYRHQGTKALEEAADGAVNPFLRKGIHLVVDGYDRYEIRNILEKEYEIYFSHTESQTNILNTSAKLAPVFGFVGTIIGLISVLSHMGEPTEIGKGMALALLTTFYGLLFSNFLFLPLAKKLSERSKAEATLLNIVMEGVMDISDGKNAKYIAHRLHSYMNVYQHVPSSRLTSPTHPKSPVLDLHAQRSAAGE